MTADGRYRMDAAGRSPKLARPMRVDDLLALARQISDAMTHRDYASLPMLDGDQHAAMVDLLRLSPDERKRLARDLASDVFVAERLLMTFDKQKVKNDMRPTINTPTRDDEAEALRRMEEDSHRRWQESTLGVLRSDDEQDEDTDLTPEQRARAAMDRAAAARNAGKSHVHRRDR